MLNFFFFWLQLISQSFLYKKCQDNVSKYITIYLHSGLCVHNAIKYVYIYIYI